MIERLDDTTDDQTQLPPHDLQAELNIVGAVLKHAEAMSRVHDLKSSEFYSPKFAAIWRAMTDLFSRSVPIDYASVSARMKRDDLSGLGVGYPELLNIAADTVGYGGNIEYHARLVSNAATQRRFISMAANIAAASWRPGADIAELIAKIDGWVVSARPTEQYRDLYDPERWADEFYADLEARSLGQRKAVGTGLLALDEMTGGLEAGALYLLMGATGHGKSEIAQQVGIHVGRNHGPVVIGSVEMDARRMAHRYARITHGMDRNRLAKGELNDQEQRQVLSVMEQMRKDRNWIESPRGRYTTSDLRATCLEVQARVGKLSLIIADYIQEFADGDGNPAHREINVGMVASGLKRLASEFDCPVLAPCQQNRDATKRVSDPRPKLSDVRESDKLAQASDFVVGLFRPEKHDPNTSDRGICEIHVLKNRTGVGDTEGYRRIVWAGTRYGDLTHAYTPLPMEDYAA